MTTPAHEIRLGQRHTDDAEPIRGPGQWQLLFNIPRIQRNPLAYLAFCARRYGDLVAFKAGDQPAYFVNSPSAVKHILQDNHRNYTKDTIQYRQLASITGRGLLTSDGDEWLSHRRLMQPAFHPRRMEGMSDGITRATADLIDEWRTRLGNATQVVLDIDAEMLRLALRIAGLTLFSIDLGREAPRLTQAVLVALDHIVHRASNFLALPDHIPTPRNRRFHRALATLDETVDELIAARRAGTHQPNDLLAALLNARDAETSQELSKQAIRDEVLTLLIAGHETSASALTWTWHLLSRHPHIQKALKQEIIRVIGARPVHFTDLPHLTFCRHVIDEALRLYPPAWLITRRTVDSDRLDGHAIPAGAIVIISPYILHRHPTFWHDADRFAPQRFEEEWPRHAYIPFGNGPRVCIGQHFALIETLFIVASIAQHFCFEPAERRTVSATPLVTLRPRVGRRFGLRVQMKLCPA